MRMPELRRARITGTGSFVPPRVVTNDDLSRQMDTSDEWIQQRTGIRERHHVDEGTGPVDLAFEASRKALEAAGLEASELDAILVPSLSPEHDFPGTSAFLQHRLGVSGIPAMDIRCQCTGFLYALQVANLYVGSGQYDRVLVCGTEVHSTGVEFSDRGRDVAVLFGDGAGAVILEPSDDPRRGIETIHTHADGQYAEKLWIEAPGSIFQPRISQELIDAGRHLPRMDGRFVFKHAVRRMPEAIREALDCAGWKLEEIDLFLFHQANLRINEFVCRQMAIPAEKTHSNIERYGNCSAASIPMCLDEVARAGRLAPGDRICMAGFGSGFTWGSALVRW
ncbi:MAG: 3-oxoacyl-ACP synthase III family protein [Myxococcota bacterium]